ncbi:MAG: SDR family oxidoreductase [Candidatus Thiodiazotropha taylori]|nr:SDR family oxidoreductase [Candidatus Thiodiazotropha taylori]MCG8107302.1 SDR family oxidoreductase [Candidatus Thiodiazotropha taylori]MCG8109371.1 SDR family oxidoreductase [Candidatus Thiodiazotropha taylori]MCW4279639.1 SDR family oxidoreductase [Candidatus Thiodiazotropha taylori]MCW4281709.1 SDR family oxidoreductase [Candidatus Thiodiazotropha taylori]
MTDNKSILITGCSSGIGLCVARGLKERGYAVYTSARKAEDVSMLQQQGFKAFRLDLTQSETIDSTLEQVLEDTGGTLYALFNNGAYGQVGAVEDLSVEVLREQFETNFFGWHDLTRRVIPVMRAQGTGRIIQNSSILGFMTLPYRGAYVASKYALEGLTDTMRLELAESGIKVSLIEPGPIESRFRDNALAMWQKNIDPESSVHRIYYQSTLERLRKQGAATPFTLPAEAVLKKVIHALESRRPKIRYPVTFPTYLFGMLRRLLTSQGMDRVLLKVSASGKR